MCRRNSGLSFRAANTPSAAYINYIPLTGGAAAGTFPLTVPNIASDRPTQWEIGLDNNVSYVATSPILTTPATFTPTLANALPASVAADPFTPAHTITVCPSGCNFAHPQDAIDSTINSGFDNVLITIQVAEYHFDRDNITGSSQNSLNISGYNNAMPPHLWIKGIIGNSGTHGTVSPVISGYNYIGTGPTMSLVGPTEVTVDNMGFWGNARLTTIGIFKATFRNIYIHDCHMGLEGVDHITTNIYVYNSHFARCGGGNGPEHNIYIGEGNDVGVFVLKNSISEQAELGHDVKSRAMSTTLTCNKLLMNQDAVYTGSQLLNCPEGRICNVNGTLFAHGGPGSQRSLEVIRYGEDGSGAPPPNNILSLQNNVFVSDTSGLFNFIGLISILWLQARPTAKQAISLCFGIRLPCYSTTILLYRL